MSLPAHSAAWYDRLATLQQGYYYPWQSTTAPHNGEDAYLDLVSEHLTPQTHLLDIGCGHGEVPLDLAPRCRFVTAYDRCAAYIEIACRSAESRGIDNVRFVCMDSKPEENEGRFRGPVEDASIDLAISRRGPMHWIPYLREFVRLGGTVIQLNPGGAGPEPSWYGDLPELLRRGWGDLDLLPTVVERLDAAGVRLHSWWRFDVPEWIASPDDLFRVLTFGCDPDEVPAFDEVGEDLQRLFEMHADASGLEFRNRRLLWKAVVS